MLTFGPLGFSIPPMENKEVSGWCRLPADMTLLYSFPHMHEVGVGFGAYLSVARVKKRRVSSISMAGTSGVSSFTKRPST